jgi:threonylcarbamoyladenosine tRNA methylthiotransferase MtaB
MHRRYTPEEYMASAMNLRKYMPDCAVTTDVIAGFPGETEAEFQETADFIQAVKLARIHVFPYSRRKGTVADRLPGHVPEDIKHIRAKKLIEIGNILEREYVSSMIGTVQSVLFEQSVGEPGCGMAEGYTGQYIRVRAKAQPGEIRDVRLLSAEGTLALAETIPQTGKG